MKYLFKYINYSLVIVVIIVSVALIYITMPFFGNQALIVRSGSMTPTIGVGSVAVVSAKQNSPVYKTGDIIAFRSEKNSKTIITHRIVGVEPLKSGGIVYKTKGDANDDPDAALVKSQNILGKTHIVIPYVGKILAFAKSDIGFPSLILFPAIVVILFESWSIFKEIHKTRRIKDSFGFVNYDLKKKNKISFFGFRVLAPLLIFSLFIPSTLAYFSDSETSTGNVFQAAESFGPPIAQTLVMNELLPLSSEDQGQDNCQFLELWNGSGSTVSLQNFKLTDGTATVAVVNSNTDLPNGQFAVIAKSVGILNQCEALENMPNGTVTANFGGQVNLNTGLLRLLDSSDVVIDTIIWGSVPNPEPGTDESIERDPTGLDSATGSNFEPSDFVIRETPTPGS